MTSQQRVSPLYRLSIATLVVAHAAGCNPSAKAPIPTVTVDAARAGSPGAEAHEAGACPSVRRFRVAESTTEGRPSNDKTWMLHEVLLRDPKTPIDATEMKPISAAEARKLGATPNDDPVWILNDHDPPCRMTPTGYAFQRIIWGPQFERVVRVLEGSCPPRGNLGRAVAFQQKDAPSDCRLRDPDKLRPIPLPRDLLPKRPCPDGTCEFKEQLRGGTLERDHTVIEILATWLYPTKENECTWMHEDFHDVFVRTASGRPFFSVPGVDKLFGALEDKGGVHAVFDDARWTMGAIPILEGDRAGERINLTTHVAHEEDSVWNSLAPYCGP